MNEIKDIKITPKKVLFGVVALVIFYFVYWMITGWTQSNLGLTGTVTTTGAPTFMAPNSYGAPVMGRANKMVAEYAPSQDSYMPSPLPGSSAPAGVSKIVKTGNLTLLVKNVDEVATAISNLRVTLGGQPGNASFSEYGNGGKQGDITIWVPAEKFDSAMDSIKKLALRVNNEQISVQDVSAQFVDLESSLRNLKSAEVQYQEIMKRSGKISEVLEVTRALNETRARIEQTQGQMDYLSRQVALSSIHVSLSQEAIPGQVISNEWRPMTVVKSAFKGTLSDLTSSIDSFLVLVIRLPVLLLNLAFWVIVLLVLYRAGKWGYHRMLTITSTTPKQGI